jgi:hypothetical protein
VLAGSKCCEREMKGQHCVQTCPRSSTDPGSSSLWCYCRHDGSELEQVQVSDYDAMVCGETNAMSGVSECPIGLGCRVDHPPGVGVCS